MDEIEKMEEWYLNIDYREAKEIIRNKLQGMTQNFIGIGFYLRQIKETEGFQKDGYASIYEMAEDQYGIKRSTAIRWMQMNEKFSQGGYSPFLDMLQQTNSFRSALMIAVLRMILLSW